MNIRNFPKLIFFVFSLINLFPASKATTFHVLEDSKDDQINNYIWSKVPNKPIKTPNIIVFKKYNKNLYNSSIDQLFANLGNYDQRLFFNFKPNKDELEIQSDTQSEENNILVAEGDVQVSYKGNFLTADSLIYDKANKTISANGNISLLIGKQILQTESFKYDFINKNGYLLKVQGLISTDKIINDLYSNFDGKDIKKIQILKQIKKKNVLNTPNKVNNWVFFTDKIEIHDEEWKSEKIVFTNDLLELNQVNIVITSLKVTSKNEELRFKSSINYVILDEKLSLPFWLGDRSLNKPGDSFSFLSRWNLGFDNFDKDGYFIGRKINSIDLSDNFVLDLEPQFLIQRSLKGYTKSFVNKGDSITANKVKRDTSFEDYFALNSKIKGKINDWDLIVDKQLNSFDAERFSDALRVKANLVKTINFLNSKWDNSFYALYRDRIWNGSNGESEIYTGYGSKLEKQNTWEVNGIIKSEMFSIGLGIFKGEDLNSKNLVSSIKTSFLYSLDQKIPVLVDNHKNNFIDNSFKYISKPIKKGFSINTKLEVLYSLYENGNHQEYFGFGAGPELIFGNFKKNLFDYTRITVLPFYKLNSGDSIFKFDQVFDKFSLDIAFDQQLFGPMILKSSGTINLDNDSKDYGEFINSKISLNWKKRSYELGIFYQPHNEAGGIGFNLFGFE